MEFEFRFRGRPQTAPRRDRETPSRLLICGDFSFRSALNRDAEPLASRPLSRLDVDNFDDAMRRMAARVAISPDGNSNAIGELAIDSLDDFHPDALCRRIAHFEVICELRRRLLDPRTAADAIRALEREAAAVDRSKATATPAVPMEDQAAMLTRLLGTPPSAATTTQPNAAVGLAIDDILRRAVAGHVTPAVDRRQSEFVASADHMLGESMRRLLHSPPFQRLEAAWRSLHWLVTNVGPDEDLQIVALDVTKQELATDLLSANSLDDSAIYRRIADGAPWSLIVGDYVFAPNGEDASLLAACGALAASAGGPFLAAADNSLLGCRIPHDCSAPKAWHPAESESMAPFQALRRSSPAAFIALTWPRWLLRAPYGAKRDLVESFAFEEIDGPPEHDSLLWGNAAFAAAAAIATIIREETAAVPLEATPFEIGDLPLYAYDERGESQMLPCAECWLTEEGSSAALARGVIPIVSIRGRNAVRLLRLQSIADPAAPLSGLTGV